MIIKEVQLFISSQKKLKPAVLKKRLPRWTPSSQFVCHPNGMICSEVFQTAEKITSLFTLKVFGL
jgi:hypothetical protein